jgi:phosphatidylglycerol---prolipoprotein diacylglyceryl transferase
MPKELRRVPNVSGRVHQRTVTRPSGSVSSASFVHPHLFQFGRLVLPTYGFLLALGTVLSLLVCIRTARLLSLDTDKIWSLAVVAIVTSLLGSRILLVLLHWPRYGARALSMIEMHSFGSRLAGIAIAILASVAYTRHLRLPIRRTADAFAPSLALGSSVVSIGCLEAGCDYGTPTRLPWAVIFTSPQAAPGTPLGVPLHPTQIYSSGAEFLLFVLLLWLLHRPHDDGEILGAWLFLGGLSSFLLTFLRGDAGPWVFGLIPGTQLVAAAMVLAGALFWMHGPQNAQVPASG